MGAQNIQIQELHKAIDHVSNSLHEFINLMFADNGKDKSVTSTTAPTKRKRAEKDPNAPKRNLSSYMLYSQDVRPKVVEENPELKAIEIAKHVGEMWNKLTDKEKAPYVKQAEKEKQRFDKENATYKTSLASEEQNGSDKTKETAKASPKTSPKPSPKAKAAPKESEKVVEEEAKESSEEPSSKKAKKNKKDKHAHKVEKSTAGEKKLKKKTF